MKQLCLAFLTLVASLAGPAMCFAQTSDDVAAAAGSSQGSTVLQAATLLVVVACLFAAVRLHSAIRGGRVAQGWMWVLAGLLVFAVGQTLLFAGQLGFLPLGTIWIEALRIISLLLFFVGINQLRKIMA